MEIRNISSDDIYRLGKSDVIVYESNFAGRPHSNSSLIAFKIGNATYGRCHGLDNNSYGIPTKDKDLKVLPLERIEKYVKNFIVDAQTNPDYTFHVTAIGTGLAGYTVNDIAPLFDGAQHLKNVYLPQEFWEILNHKEI